MNPDLLLWLADESTSDVPQRAPPRAPRAKKPDPYSDAGQLPAICSGEDAPPAPRAPRAPRAKKPEPYSDAGAPPQRIPAFDSKAFTSASNPCPFADIKTQFDTKTRPQDRTLTDQQTPTAAPVAETRVLSERITERLGAAETATRALSERITERLGAAEAETQALSQRLTEQLAAAEADTEKGRDSRALYKRLTERLGAAEAETQALSQRLTEQLAAAEADTEKGRDSRALYKRLTERLGAAETETRETRALAERLASAEPENSTLRKRITERVGDAEAETRALSFRFVATEAETRSLSERTRTLSEQLAATEAETHTLSELSRTLSERIAAAEVSIEASDVETETSEVETEAAQSDDLIFPNVYRIPMMLKRRERMLLLVDIARGELPNVERRVESFFTTAEKRLSCTPATDLVLNDLIARADVLEASIITLISPDIKPTAGAKSCATLPYVMLALPPIIVSFFYIMQL